MTDAMKSALKWLRNRNADGVFDRNQVLTAGGEKAPVRRSTWNKLENEGMVEFYMNRRRVRVTGKGSSIDLSKVSEST
jgi:hypothetical protein